MTAFGRVINVGRGEAHRSDPVVGLCHHRLMAGHYFALYIGRIMLYLGWYRHDARPS